MEKLSVLVVLLMGFGWIAVASALKKTERLYYFDSPPSPSSTLCTHCDTCLNPCTDPAPPPPPPLLVGECPPPPVSSATPSPPTPSSSSTPPSPSSSSPSPGGYKYPPTAPYSYILPPPPPSGDSGGDSISPPPPPPSEADNYTPPPPPYVADTVYAPPPPSTPQTSYNPPSPPPNGRSSYYPYYPYYYLYTPSASAALNLRLAAALTLFLQSVLLVL